MAGGTQSHVDIDCDLLRSTDWTPFVKLRRSMSWTDMLEGNVIGGKRETNELFVT